MPARKDSADPIVTSLRGLSFPALQTLNGGTSYSNVRVTPAQLVGGTTFNVRNYMSDGVTTEDAFDAAIEDMEDEGGGVLRCPGEFTVSRGFEIGVPCAIVGDGPADYYGEVGGTRILCTSPTAIVFEVTAPTGDFYDLGFVNTTGAETAGSAIRTNGSTLAQRVNFHNISVHGFYDGIDVKVGAKWYGDGVDIMGPARYGIRIRNTVNADAGDWHLSNFNVWSYLRDAVAGIRQESGGAGTITNFKINAALQRDLSFHVFTNGIDLANIGSGGGTTILRISNGSIENYGLTGGAGVLLNNWRLARITGVQFGLYAGNTSFGVKATDCEQLVLDNDYRGPATFESLTNCAFAKSTFPAVRLVGGSGEPAFQNGWQNTHPSLQSAGFYLDYMGMVNLEGCVQLGTFGTTIFTLPVGYRPPLGIIYPSWASGVAVMTIGADGTVKVDSPAGSNLAVSIAVPPFRPVLV